MSISFHSHVSFNIHMIEYFDLLTLLNKIK
jgi:hypothetical protein